VPLICESGHRASVPLHRPMSIAIVRTQTSWCVGCWSPMTKTRLKVSARMAAENCPVRDSCLVSPIVAKAFTQSVTARDSTYCTRGLRANPSARYAARKGGSGNGLCHTRGRSRHPEKCCTVLPSARSGSQSKGKARQARQTLALNWAGVTAF
jgi:hypothetical protein